MTRCPRPRVEKLVTSYAQRVDGLTIHLVRLAVYFLATERAVAHLHLEMFATSASFDV
jgi:hypothetical protein